MIERRRLALPIAAAILLLAALAFALLAGSGSSKHTTTGTGATATTASTPAEGAQAGSGGFDGAAVPAPAQAPEFALEDQYGRPVSLRSLRGQPVVIAFLYAHCGAACVLIAQQIRGAVNELPHPVPVLLISADPAGDSPAAVRRFLASVSLSGRVHYLTGTRTQLAPVWRAYRVRPASAGRATFDNYATVLLLDPAGRERVLYGQEQLTPEALAHDIAKLQPASGG